MLTPTKTRGTTIWFGYLDKIYCYNNSFIAAIEPNGSYTVRYVLVINCVPYSIITLLLILIPYSENQTSISLIIYHSIFNQIAYII